jgi:hypothetical protein
MNAETRDKDRQQIWLFCCGKKVPTMTTTTMQNWDAESFSSLSYSNLLFPPNIQTHSPFNLLFSSLCAFCRFGIGSLGSLLLLLLLPLMMTQIVPNSPSSSSLSFRMQMAMEFPDCFALFHPFPLAFLCFPLFSIPSDDHFESREWRGLANLRNLC